MTLAPALLEVVVDIPVGFGDRAYIRSSIGSSDGSQHWRVENGGGRGGPTLLGIVPGNPRSDGGSIVITEDFEQPVWRMEPTVPVTDALPVAEFRTPEQEYGLVPF